MVETVVFLGSELKLRVEIDPVGEYTMDDFDFNCEFYCFPSRKVKVAKKQMARGDQDVYYALVDTSELGTGLLKCKVTAYIPDTYGGDDWARTEVANIDTGICITRG